jgi:hypothetical protein
MNSNVIHASDLKSFHPEQLKRVNIVIKQGGFNPSPIAGKIPAFANSRLNPDVIGTPFYNEFWEEQVYRCENGYSTGGIYIPGRHYYYMNFQPIAGVTGVMYPMYIEFDREFFSTVDWVKINYKTGIIILKARRKGLSEKVKGGVINYGSTFTEKYRAGVFAGIDFYVQGIKKKIIMGATECPDDMRMGIIKNNDKQLKFGYEERILGSYTDSGALTEIQFETLFNNAVKMEGEYFNDVISEESGENPHLKMAFESIKPSLMFGAKMVGTFYIYGTAGNILSSSKDFIEMYNNHEDYDLVKMWVPGTRMYFPFVSMKKNEPYYDNVLDREIDPIHNLRPLIEEHGEDALLGCEDIEAGKENIAARYKKYEKLDDRKSLIELKKNYPLEEEDAITSGGSNNFDNELLFDRLNTIQMNPPPIGKYVLDFIYDKGEDGDNVLRIPLEVSIRPAKIEDPEWKCVLIRQHPLKSMRNADAMGVDSYNQDQTNTTRSLGGIAVMRDGRTLPSIVDGMAIHKGVYPVCIYQQRPPKKELFFEIALKIAVYYKLYRDVMISAEHDFCIDYFKKNNGRAYLSPRPRSFDSPDSEAKYDYGAKFNVNKGRIIGIIQSWVDDYAYLCDFELLLKELIAFDEINMGSDWDIVDAVGYCLMRIIDRKSKPKDSNNSTNQERIEWQRDKDGNVRAVGVNTEKNDDVIYFGNKKVGLS